MAQNSRVKPVRCSKNDLFLICIDYGMIGTTPHTAGADGTGFVLWDPQGEPPQALNR